MNNTTDLWLERWLPLIVEQAGEGELLEIGCGWGWDTAIFVEAGLKVFAIDKSDLISKTQESVRGASFQQTDVRDFFPTQSKDHYPVIIASLSLHYFEWEETVRLIGDVWDALQPEGLLFFRVNSTKDVENGAQGFPEIDYHFYAVEDRTKRFFDEDDLARLFGDSWERLSQCEMNIDRFNKPKVAWEVVLKKKSALEVEG